MPIDFESYTFSSHRETVNWEHDNCGCYFSKIFSLLRRSGCVRLVENGSQLKILFLELLYFAWFNFQSDAYKNFAYSRENTTEITCAIIKPPVHSSFLLLLKFVICRNQSLFSGYGQRLESKIKDFNYFFY